VTATFDRPSSPISKPSPRHNVIHAIDSVIKPADVSITIAKLIRGSVQNTMMNLMVRAGLSWILEGREPTSSELQRVFLDGFVLAGDDEDDDDLPDMDSLTTPSYTVLCPTDEAFSRLNLTHYISDKEALVNLLKLHIIPSQLRVLSKIPATGDVYC